MPKNKRITIALLSALIISFALATSVLAANSSVDMMLEDAWNLLNSGDNEQSIQYFTKVIQLDVGHCHMCSKDQNDQMREKACLAYEGRSRAFYNLGAYKRAAGDASTAIRMHWLQKSEIPEELYLIRGTYFCEAATPLPKEKAAPYLDICRKDTVTACQTKILAQARKRPKVDNRGYISKDYLVIYQLRLQAYIN